MQCFLLQTFMLNVLRLIENLRTKFPSFKSQVLMSCYCPVLKSSFNWMGKDVKQEPSLAAICATLLAFTERGAVKASSVAFTISSARCSTSAMQKQRACLTHIWEISPVWDPESCSLIPCPAPVTRRWNLWNFVQSFLPDKGSTQDCSLCMLKKCMLSR